MSIINLTEIKDMLSITDSSYDVEITSKIKAAEEILFGFVKNSYIYFPEMAYTSNTISFDGTSLSINDLSADFVTLNYLIGLKIRITGSLLNDGYYELAQVSKNSLSLIADEELKDESEGRYITIEIASIPERAKLFIAKLIEFWLVNKSSRDKITSEKLGDSTVTFLKPDNIPNNILNIIIDDIQLNWS